MSSSLSGEQRVVGELEGFDPMRLEAMGAPDAGHGRGAGAQVSGQRASAPVRRALRGLLGRDAHHLRHIGGRARRSWASRARGVLHQTVHASGKKARSPARGNTAVRVEFERDVLVRHSVAGQKHDACAHLNARFDALALGKNPQASLLVGTQRDWLGNSHGADLLERWRPGGHLSSFIYAALH